MNENSRSSKTRIIFHEEYIITCQYISIKRADSPKCRKTHLSTPCSGHQADPYRRNNGAASVRKINFLEEVEAGIRKRSQVMGEERSSLRRSASSVANHRW